MKVAEDTTTAIQLKLVVRIILGGFGIGALTFAFLQFVYPRPSLRVAKTTCASVSQEMSVYAPVNPLEAENSFSTLGDRTRAVFKMVPAGTAKKADMNQLKTLLQERKQALIQTMAANPDRALEDIFDKTRRADLGSVTTHCVEESAVLEGQLTVIAIDYTDGTSATEYTLKTKSGENVRIHPANLSHDVRSGQQVRVSGFQLDDHLLVDDSDGITITTPLSAEQGIEIINDVSALTSGEQKTLVLYIDFNDTTPLPPCGTPPNCMDQDKIYNAMFNPNIAATTDKYIREVSYGQTWLGSVNNPRAGEGKMGDIYGTPYEVNNSKYDDLEVIATAAMQRAEDIEGETVLNFTLYKRLVIVMPLANGLYSGFGTVGSKSILTPDGWVTLSISWINRFSTDSIDGVISHEVGHNFGNGHANWIDCGTVPLGPNCTTMEYGDGYDKMGRSEGGHYNALHKVIPGWLSSTPGAVHEIRTVTAPTGTYDLAPIESLQGGLQALKIKRNMQGTEHLYVEFRQPIGFDAGFCGNCKVKHIFQGGLLYLQKSGNASASYVFQATASSVRPASYFDCPALPVNFVNPDTGPGFYDAATGTRIKVLSITVDQAHPENSRLRVEVTLGQDFYPPTVSFVPPTPSSGSTVSGQLAVAVNATDNAGIDHVEFQLTGEGVTRTVTVTTGTENVYSAQFDTRLNANGGVALRVYAYDTGGNVVQQQITFMNNNVDPVPPTVNITQPLDGAVIPSSPVAYAATASDNTAIWKVVFWDIRNGGAYPIATDRQEPYEGSYSFGQGPHTLKAVAYDYAGNMAESVVYFSIPDTIPPVAQIVSPASNTTISGVSSFIVDTSDNVGVTSIEVYVEGRSTPIAVGPAQGSSTTFSVDTRNSLNGIYAYYAKAYDAAGNVVESAHIPNVTIQNTTIQKLPKTEIEG